MSNINENNNREESIYKLSTNLISLCRNFSLNIYEQYNETINIVSLEYIDKDNNNIVIKQDENIIQNIKKNHLKLPMIILIKTFCR